MREPKIPIALWMVFVGDIAELYETVIEDGHIIAASDECDASSKRFLAYPVICGCDNV